MKMLPAVGTFERMYSQLQAYGGNIQSLQDQKNKLISHLYDKQLTPEEMNGLSPAQQAELLTGSDEQKRKEQLIVLTAVGGAAVVISALFIIGSMKADKNV